MPHEYGIAGQMKNMISSKRDANFEKAALMWIFGFLGEPVPDQPIEQALHDGQVLLRFLKKIQPDLVKNIGTKNEAQMRENIGNFVAGLTKLGVRGSDIFQTNDLFDAKNIPAVMVSLSALGTELQKGHPEIPAFGPPPKA